MIVNILIEEALHHHSVYPTLMHFPLIFSISMTHVVRYEGHHAVTMSNKILFTLCDKTDEFIERIRRCDMEECNHIKSG